MSEHSKVSWGSMVAGAAVATGALLLAVSIKPDLLASLGETFGSLGETLKDLGSSIAKSIGGMFSSTTVNEYGEVLAKEGMSEGAKRLLGAIGGVALIGGGRAYFKGQEHARQMQAALGEDMDPQDRMSWADREKMRAMQGVMQARMGMANQMGRA